MHDLFAHHSMQLQGLIRKHEINRIHEIKGERIDIVTIRYMKKFNQCEFGARISASACDFHVDDRTETFLRRRQGGCPVSGILDISSCIM